MKSITLILAMLLHIFPAWAGEEACVQEDTEVWEVLCETGGLLPLEGCSVEDFCVAAAPQDTGEEAVPQAEILKKSRVIRLNDAPEGFEERIYIID